MLRRYVSSMNACGDRCMQVFEIRHMKTISKRHSFEEMKRFIYAFAAAVVPAGKPVFYVNATSKKNRFFFRVKPESKDCLYYLSYNRWNDDIGSFGKVDSLFRKTNPRIMLREQIVSLEELVNEFKLDEKKLVNVVFSRINQAINDALKCVYPNNKMHFTVKYDNHSTHMFNIPLGQQYACSDFECNVKTPDVTTIDELIVWADLKAGVN